MQLQILTHLRYWDQNKQKDPFFTPTPLLPYYISLNFKTSCLLKPSVYSRSKTSAFRQTYTFITYLLFGYAIFSTNKIAFRLAIFIFSTEDDIAEKLLLFKISCCYLKPIDYLDMANLWTCVGTFSNNILEFFDFHRWWNTFIDLLAILELPSTL